MQRISIVGLGRMGGALAIALARAGYEIADLVVRRPESADTVLRALGRHPRVTSLDRSVAGDIVIIATSDPSIAQCSEALARNLSGRPIILHTSGSLSSDVLSACSNIGCETGSMHPLVSVSEPEAGSRAFAGRYFCLEGSEAAVAAAGDLVDSLNGYKFSIESRFKALYHAAAVTSAGHVVALFAAAVEILSKCGVDDVTARAVLFPLLESTVGNLRSHSPETALTGTFARLDTETFERHLQAFNGLLPDDLRQLYLLLGERSVGLAESAGADAAAVAEFRRRITMAKKELEC